MEEIAEGKQKIMESGSHAISNNRSMKLARGGERVDTRVTWLNDAYGLLFFFWVESYWYASKGVLKITNKPINSIN